MMSQAKKIIPPLLYPFLRRVYHKLKFRKPIYEKNVVKSFNELRYINNNVWDSEEWINHAKSSLIYHFDDLKATIHFQQVKLCLGIYFNFENKKKIDIYDIGGGVGLYYPIISEVAEKSNIDFTYYLHDSKLNCDISENYFPGRSNFVSLPHEETDIIKAVANVDIASTKICILSSSLQYIMGWKQFLKQLLISNPRFVFILRLPSSELATESAFTVQNVFTYKKYCGSVPVNLLSSGEVINLMKQNGYFLLSQQEEPITADYWQSGCSDEKFKKIRIKALVFYLSEENNLEKVAN